MLHLYEYLVIFNVFAAKTLSSSIGWTYWYLHLSGPECPRLDYPPLKTVSIVSGNDFMHLNTSRQICMG